MVLKYKFIIIYLKPEGSPMEQTLEKTRSEEQDITNKSSLAEFFYKSFKDKSDFKIGVEFERLGINAQTHHAISYSDTGGTAQILNNLKKIGKYKEITENGMNKNKA